MFKTKALLLFNMLIAANSAALAIYLSFRLADEEISYWYCLGLFLAMRVILFMANKQMPLEDENVKFMSSERTLWNVATVAVVFVMYMIKTSIDWLMS